MAMSTDACWGGHFCVAPGIFVSNRAFLCWNMHFAVEPDFFVSNECYNEGYALESIFNIDIFRFDFVLRNLVQYLLYVKPEMLKS